MIVEIFLWEGGMVCLLVLVEFECIMVDLVNLGLLEELLFCCCVFFEGFEVEVLLLGE